MHQFLPSFPLAGAAVVVVGSGDAAENKLRLFRTSPCRLVWYSLDRIAPPPADLSPLAEVVPGRALPENAFDGALFAFIATEDEAEAAALAKKARRAGALVNVVDQPSLCMFHTPALVDRGTVTIGIATGGTAPVLARDVRARIESVLPKGLGLLSRCAKHLRTHINAAAEGPRERRKLWESALRGPAAEAADRGHEAETRRALLRSVNRAASNQVEQGSVALVGAGPGDPELLTVKASRLLRDADVIVFDRLVSALVLDRARRDAIRVDVGKTRGRHPVPQEDINKILVAHALAGRKVVRLKGGDSFIFGRGGEELEACRKAGVAAEVVPGISAALACAASAQTPLTHRDHAQAVTFVTGQPKKDGPEPNLAALAADNHTLVYYMAVARAGAVTSKLIGAGRDPATPVAVVENGSRPEERILAGTLGDLAGLIAREQVKGPAVLIIGEVARRARVSEIRAIFEAEAA